VLHCVSHCHDEEGRELKIALQHQHDIVFCAKRSW
jgi:hypothetical protein